jgi:hypothetical protein
MGQSPHRQQHLSCKGENDYLPLLGYNGKSIKLPKFITSATSQLRFGVKVLMQFEDLSKFHIHTLAL